MMVTARHFFKDSSLSATTTGFDEDIIKRYFTILRVISSGFPINREAFDKYVSDTTKWDLQLYPWYYMPASVRKILIHGSKIIESAIIPISQLSDEAQEARNKDYKRYRERNYRKFSRKSSMMDVLHMLLISSDPKISLIAPLSRKNKTSFPIKVVQLLKQPDIPSMHEEECEVGNFHISLESISDSSNE